MPAVEQLPELQKRSELTGPQLQATIDVFAGRSKTLELSTVTQASKEKDPHQAEKEEESIGWRVS
jgi:hypothetical protein